MVLSKGDATSLTPAPKSIPLSVSPSERARLRFQVEGNAIVTGGAGTLGFEASRALLEHGAKGLMIFDVNPTQSSLKAAELQKEFPSATLGFKIVDITDEAAVKVAVDETAEYLGSIDILLSFAGVVGCSHALTMTPQEFRRTLDINTTGAFLVAHATAPHMIAQGRGGSITFIASISGHRVNYPQPQVAYNVSKAAIITLKNGLAAEWARYGIRTNTISPGYADTILNEGEGLRECREVWMERNPMGRMGAPCELTGVVVLLCSRAGSYINGSDFVVDGGQTLF
ncbi:hypothetical protein HYALB_00002009 [Hymenoscyphus albidus]|uniref:NAD(P)-binding protein n=1 Tax=Hymenoscyphus albidus TaxID=595503 RepID=A0A9N9LEZ9_9HELO|nr:hypothetical protein HYALB_00002009 [Hymenoscyphus albidus]